MSFTTSDSTSGPAAISVQSADGTLMVPGQHLSSTPSDVSSESSPAATPAADTDSGTQAVDAFVLDAPASASDIADDGLAPSDTRWPSLLHRPRPGAETGSDDDDDDEDAFIPRGTQTNGSVGVKKPPPTKPTKPST